MSVMRNDWNSCEVLIALDCAAASTGARVTTVVVCVVAGILTLGNSAEDLRLGGFDSGSLC